MTCPGIAELGTARTASDAETLVREFEMRYEPLAHRLDGWAVWCLLRTDAAVVIQQPPLKRGGTALPRGMLLRAAQQDARKMVRLPRADILAHTFTSGLADRRGDRYVDIWYDDLLATLGRSAVKLETLNSALFVRRRASALVPADLTTSLVDLLAGVRLRGPLSPHVSSVAARIERDLQEAFGPRFFPGGWAAVRIQHFAARRAALRRILRRVAPRVVLVADPGQFAVVAAAKEAGAAVAELQHGYIDGRAHPAYGWTADALPARPAMPIADRLFVYGEAWKRTLEPNGFWNDAIRVVGSARVDDYRQQRRTRRNDGRMRVLVTSQGVATAELVRFLAAALAATPDEHLEVIVKLHPVHEADPTTYWDHIRDPRLSVIAGNAEQGTFELLCDADMHVSIYSSCHLEAIALGIPTVVLPLSGYEAVADLIQRGAARVAHTPEKLAGLWSSPPAEDTARFGTDYFATEFLARARGEVDALMSGSN